MLLRPSVRATCSVVASAVAMLLPCAHAQVPAVPASTDALATERESLESLRQTTLALIEALVQSGTLSREKADALLADAKRRAQSAAAVGSGSNWGDPARASDVAPVVRVPYVPQVVRDQIRNELREEIVARARVERWGVPNATAEWTDRISMGGDLRVRQQNDRPASDNTPPDNLLLGALASGATRAVDLAAATSTGQPTGNTLEGRDRMRLRARLAFNVKVSETVTAGLRLSTGNAADRVSTNQTLGQNFNRQAILLDRAFVRIDPNGWVSASAGRIPNPWFSTDLVWSDNLNFDGVAASFRPLLAPNSTWAPFLTVGWFPVRESSPPKRGRSLAGAQLGVTWDASPRTRLKFGIAQYVYNGFAGQIDNDFDPVTGAGRSYGQFEYEAGLRQRGNSLFLTNNPAEISAGLTPDKARWGLGMRFRPVAVTAAAEFTHFAPVVVGLSAEVVHNQGFSLDEAYVRTGGIWFNEARAFGAGLRATIGTAEVRNAGEWQFNLGYRWLGSDAVPDAFVDSDLAGGGTNVQGWMLGGVIGLARDTNLSLRVLSGRTISSPTVVWRSTDKYGLTTLQADLNVRF